jgi:ABC-type multidrug transport system ATPase subunit
MRVEPDIQTPKPESAGSFRIATQNLSKRFNREWIFRDLSFTFQSGTVYAITGPNGSGKSTLMQILWGQMPPTSGTIEYFQGTSIIEQENLYRHVTMAAPYMDLIDEFTLTEQLRFHFRLRRSRDNMEVPQLLEVLGMEKFSQKYIGNFSSGMKQRVKLGLALLTQAEAVFLDEPGTNLDEKAFAWYLDLLKKVPANVVIFIASNQPREYPPDAIRLDLTAFK